MGKYVFSEQSDAENLNRFSEENGGSVYQTSYWAEVKNAWKPTFYMGFKEDGTAVLSALCLERNVKVGKIWYCPDGFVCDLLNEQLVLEFSEFMISEMKKKKICALICDPLIVKKVDGEERETPEISAMLKSGFVLNKDKSFYIVQPNLTIQTPLKNHTPETLLKKCEKGVRHGLRAAEDGALFAEEYDDKTLPLHPEKLDEFFEVMTETSDRVSFIQRDKSYYAKIISALKGKAVMNLIYCDNKKRNGIYKNALAKKESLLFELEEIQSGKKDKKTASAIKKEIEGLDTTISRNEKVSAELEEKFGENVPDKICLAVGITSRFGKTAICLYGGTVNLLRNTLRPTHFLNWTRIMKSFDMGIETHDLGRVTGDPYDENNPLYGLCRYKRSYCGEVTEFVGDMYLVADKFRFMLFRNLLPKFKKIKNTVLKKTIKSRTVKRGSR